MAELAANPVFTDPEWHDLSRDQVREERREGGREGKSKRREFPVLASKYITICGCSSSLFWAIRTHAFSLPPSLPSDP